MARNNFKVKLLALHCIQLNDTFTRRFRKSSESGTSSSLESIRLWNLNSMFQSSPSLFNEIYWFNGVFYVKFTNMFQLPAFFSWTFLLFMNNSKKKNFYVKISSDNSRKTWKCKPSNILSPFSGLLLKKSHKKRLIHLKTFPKSILEKPRVHYESR